MVVGEVDEDGCEVDVEEDKRGEVGGTEVGKDEDDSVVDEGDVEDGEECATVGDEKYEIWKTEIDIYLYSVMF